MPFRITWEGTSYREFRSVVAEPNADTVPLIAAIAGRRHDEWLQGTRISDPASAGEDLRLLELGTYTVVYVLDADAELVTISAITRR